MRPSLRSLVLSALLCGVLSCVQAAGLPEAYAAIVVTPATITVPGGATRSEFDLGPALARGRQEKKSLYVYLGASDCPYCRRYEAFLAAHARELVPHFARRYLLVDLRSALSVGPAALYIKAGGRSLPYAEFQTAIGDERARLLVYPSVWLLDADLKPLMQMPAGTGTFQTVPEQLEILDLVQ